MASPNTFPTAVSTLYFYLALLKNIAHTLFKAKHTVNVTLDGNVVAAATAVPISAGGKIDTAWHIQGEQGFFRQGYCKPAEAGFSPLYTLRSLRRRLGGRRDLPGQHTDEAQ